MTRMSKRCEDLLDAVVRRGTWYCSANDTKAERRTLATLVRRGLVAAVPAEEDDAYTATQKGVEAVAATFLTPPPVRARESAIVHNGVRSYEADPSDLRIFAAWHRAAGFSDGFRQGATDYQRRAHKLLKDLQENR